MITNSAIVNSVFNREQQIIFIDSQVKDYQFLAQGVLPGIQTVILNRNSDGIEQITEVLTQKNNYTSIHIVSHGSPGCLYLGNSQLSLDTLNQYQSELKTWFNIPPLSRGVRGDLDLLNQGVRGHILLYGCNVAAGDAGEEFITKLQAFTGAEIAASTTRIGNTDLGGNWQLDVTTSVDRPNLAFTKEAQQNYAGVLIDLFTDDFDGNTTGGTGSWAENPNNSDTAITNDSGQWTIDPILEDRFNNNNTIALQLDANSSPNALITGYSQNDDQFTEVNGITTINSPSFTLPSNGFSSIDLSLQYYVITGSTTNAADDIRVDLVKTSNGDVTTLFDPSLSANQYPTSWSSLTTSIDSSLAGEEVYLNITANDPDNGSFLEFGIDDVSVTYTIPSNEISGNVFLDSNFNGANNSDSGVQNITVNAYDATGTSVATANTDSNGDYTLTGLTDGTEYRIEFTNLPSGYFSAPTGTDNNGSVVFVSSPESSVDFGVVDPSSVDFSAPIPNSNIVQNGYAVYSCLGVETTDVVLAIRNLNSIGDVYDVPSNRGDVDSSSNFAQTTTFTRSQFEDNQIQATAIGDDGSIYVSTSGLYNNQRPGQGRPDPLIPIADPKVYRISPDGSTVELFATLPGNQGTGWMEIDEEHNQIYVSNPDDGLIYVVDSTATAGSQTASTSYTTFAPHSADALNDADTNTSGAVGFAPLGENILGVGYNKAESRLYYAIWAQDLTPNASADNTIRSIGVNPDGSFDLASDRLELTIPNENFWGNGTEVNDSSMPTLDIEFNEDGTVMLLAELTIDYDFTAVRPAHASRVLEYRGSTNNWTSETFEKHSIGQIRNFTATNGADFDNNSRGGVDFAFHTIENGNPEGYEDYVIATGDALPFDQGTDPDTLIYGFQYQPLTGGDQDSSLKIDGDGLSANQKGTFADIDVRVAYEGSIEIGNRIWNDTDADGIQDPGEAGISNVTINLYNAAGDTLLGTTTTNADGEYYFNESNVNQNGATGLEPNTSYQIQIDSSTGGLNSLNLVPQDQGANDAIDSDADDSSGTPTISITTGDYGENNYSLDAGFALTYSLSGTVYSDTNNPSGDSIEASDTPIGGVTVTLYDAADTEFASPIATTTTDATTGFYEFTNLLDGNYVVIQDQPGAYDSVTDIDGTDDNQIAVTVADANVTGQDFLEEKVVSLGSTVFTDTDNDGVQDTGEGGISGVDVELYSPGADGVVGGGDDTLVDSTTTDGDGNYQFSDLPEGGYYVSIPTSNFASGGALENTPLSSETTETTDNQVDGDDNGIQANIGEATNSPVINLIANGEPVDGTGANDETGAGSALDNGSGVANDSDGDMTVDFGFVPVYSLSGTVYLDTNNPENETIETDDTGIGGVTINLFADSDGDGMADTDGAGDLLPAIAITTTNSAGFYEFTDLVNGNYVVVQDQPTNYDSITDVDGTDDNQIAVTIDDADVIGRDFLEEAFDYGDAPDTLPGAVSAADNLANNGNDIPDYETVNDANNDGANHTQDLNQPITIGNTVDSDDGTQQNPTATADGADEDGVVVNGTTDSLDNADILAVSGNTYSVDVAVNTAPTITPGTTRTVNGQVFIDYDNDGVNDGTTSSKTETGVDAEGITVTAYANDGTVLNTAITDASGNYSLGINQPARIEFTNLPEGYNVSSQGNAANDTVSDVFFVDGTGDVSADLGILKPDNYVEEGLDPRLITTCFILGGFSGSNETGVVSVLHSANGDVTTVDKTTDATIGQVGSVYGLAYNKETKALFAGAFQKRFSDVGIGANGNDNGNGVIYRITNVDNADGADNSVDKFIDLDAYYQEYFSEADTAGAYSHGDNAGGDNASSRDSINWLADRDAFNAVTKVGLGDVEISEDRQHIYTINLADRQLYKIEIGDGSDFTYDAANPDSRSVERFDILSNLGGLQAGTVSNDLRPFAVAEKDGLIYVGLVNSAESTQNVDDLHAYVYTFNPATGDFSNSPVVDFALDYARQLKSGGLDSNWTPWVANGGDLDTLEDDFTLTTSGNANNPVENIHETQPILSDIEFDNNGDMILGFRDRTGDQVVGRSFDPDGSRTSNNGRYQVATGGDILRASIDPSGNSWIIEPGATDNDPATEVYDGDDFLRVANRHQELAQGGLTQVPGFTSVETTAFDPLETFNTGGIIGLENTNTSNEGDRTRTGSFNNGDGGGIELFRDSSNPGIRKANGLGDLEAITSLAPIEIGNRIWNDLDNDGIQDAGETGIEGVTVNLYNSAGDLVGTTTTDAKGEYYFNNDNVTQSNANGLEPNADYKIRLDNSVDFTSGGALENFNITTADANSNANDTTDSDAVLEDVGGTDTPTINVTTGDYGQNDYTNDFGFQKEVTLVGWIDFDRSGTFDPDEAVTIDTDNGLNTDGTTNTLNFTVPADVEPGATAARFRVASGLAGDNINGVNGDNTPNGVAPDGEVEDYVVNLVGTDYGDAPDTSNGTGTGDYQTTANNNGPSHTIVSGLSIGSEVDNDQGTLENNTATADDSTDTDDEDGVTFVDSTVITTSDTTYSAEVTVNVPSITTTLASDDFSSGDYTGNSTNWASDWQGFEAHERIESTNQADDTNDTGGFVQVNNQQLQIFNDERGAERRIDLSSATGTVNLSFDYQAIELDAADNAFLEVRVSNDNRASFTTIESIEFNSDPNSDNVSVEIPNSLFSSETIISFAVVSSNNADIAETEGYLIDNVEVTQTSTEGTLVGWIDFDGDGTFSPTEGIAISTDPTKSTDGTTTLNTDGVTPNTITWDGGGNPLASTTGDTYARFRLSTDPNLTTSTPDDSVTDITDGEVEDYQLTITPVYSLSGTVYEDTNNPGGDTIETTDAPIPGVTINLYADSDGNGVADTDGSGNLLAPIATTTTNSSGFYEFTDLSNGNYVVIQDQPGDYNSLTDVNGTTPDNQIAVIIADANVIERDFLEEGNYDYGDAPDTQEGGVAAPNSSTIADYQTTEDDSGAAHKLKEDSLITIGDTIDADNGTQQNAAANADIPDENGVTVSGTTDSLNGTNVTATSGNNLSVDVEVNLDTREPTGVAVTFSGTVFDDYDNDGSQEIANTPSEVGLEDITVTAYNNAGNVVATTNTDGSGAYTINNTNGEALQIEFSNLPGGYVASAGSGSSVIFSDGTADETVDVGFYDPSGSTSLEIGNRVWVDLDKDGIQDAGEAGVAGATVSLYDSTGTTLLGTTVTDAKGEYYFNSDNVKQNGATGLEPNTDYKIRLDNAADFASGGALENLNITTVDAGSNDELDSDAVLEDVSGTDTPTINVTTVNDGQNDYSNDFGFQKDVTLVGWIDFDRSGTFDPDEAVTIDTANGLNTDGTANTLDFNLPADVELGATAARFRVASGLEGDNLDGTTSTGAAPDGEVEDYVVNLVGTDYGDAPDTSDGTGTGNYQTTDKTGTDNDGASHTIVSDLTIGNVVDADNGELQNSAASADNSSNTGSANDEDGLVEFNGSQPLNINADDSFTATVNVTNNSGEAATLVGWVDFNQNGVFENTEEVIANIPTATNNENVTLTWDRTASNNAINDLSGNGDLPAIADIEAGTTYARFRLSTDSQLDENFSTGNAQDGEVEDYQLNLGVDYSDAPDADGETATGNYDTTADSDPGTTDTGGAPHGIVDGLSIGDTVDDDSGLLHDANASLDDTTDTGSSDDEDGVTFNTTSFSIANDDSYSVDVDVNIPTTTLQAEESFTQNFKGGNGWTSGEWTEIGESDGANAGRVQVNGGLLEFSNGDRSIEREFDFSTATGDGTLTFDYSYENLAAGETVTVTVSNDNNTETPVTFTIDNTGTASNTPNQTANLTIPQALMAGGASKITITSVGGNEESDRVYIDNIDLTAPVTEPASLVGWVDFNQNGAFETEEGVITTVTSSGTETLVWDRDGATDGDGFGVLPDAANIESGTTYSRFRLTQNPITTNDSIGFRSTGEVEDYKVNLGIDYGDAPDAGAGTGTGDYETTDKTGTDNDGAAHGIDSNLTIGDNIDDDSGSLQNAAADADNADGTPNDEDGVTLSTTPFSITSDSSYSTTVNVSNNTGEAAKLVGWIDFNQNGVFEATEAVSADVPDGTTTTTDITLTWDRDGATDGSGFGVLPDAADIESGSTYARFRLTTDDAFDTIEDTDSVGFLNNGEVEDHRINLGVDYGDAPDAGAGTGTGDYETTDKTGTDDDGAAHGIVDDIFMGSTVDDDLGSNQNSAADADDSDGTPDDEDGVTFNTTPLNIADDSNYSATVNVTNNTGEPAKLIGWIDFNQDGQFDATEAVRADVPDGTTGSDVTLTWDRDGGTSGSGFGVLPDAANIETGTTYARFRLSTDCVDGEIKDSHSVGFLKDGEVEDYKLNLGIDYGDAPDAGAGTAAGDYETTDKTGTDDDGAAHGIDSNLTIGDNIDDDSGSLQNAAANADNNDDIPNDEDGVTLSSTPFSITNDSSYSTIVNVNNNTGEDAKLVGWIDFNQNGIFEATEAVSADVPDGTTTATDITLTWDRDGATDGSGFGVLPDAADIESGTTYARLRLTTDNAFDTIEDTDSVGFLNNGEVEDYKLNLGVDYGDAPDAGAGTGVGDYETTDKTGTDDDGAAHGIVSDLLIGSNIDDDSGSLQNPAADADDTNGTPDDEDGVTFSSTSLNIDTDNSYSSTVNVTNNTGQTAKLIGWIDFDRDGIFEATEAVSANVPNGTAGSDVTLTWDRDGGTSGNGFGVLPNAASIESGTSYARFRLTTDPITTSNSTGFASDGEVEDYQLDLVTSTEYKMSGKVYSDTNNPSEDSIEDTDTPIGEVTLKLYTDSDGDGVKDTDDSGNLLDPIATTTTDADTGEYEFTGLANGSYVVAQDQPADYDSVTDVDNTTPDNQIAVTINDGDEIEKDFLEEKVVFIGSTVFTDSNNNGVQDTGEAGISGVDVELYAPGADGVVGGVDDTLIDSTTTDGDGNYQFSDLPEGDYYVSIPTTNFASGGALETAPLSSETTETTDNQVDGDDNGIQANSGEATNSPVINLTANGEPVDGTGANDETGTGSTLDNGSGVADDSDGDMTVDFGFVAQLDYGDAPDDGNTGNSAGDYNTLDSNNGPSHGIVNGLTLGSTVDAESDASPNTTATGDDTTGSDDEDGIEFIDTKIISNDDANDSYSVQAIVNATGDATLVGWIDFDRDGTFDSTEGVTLSSDLTKSTDGSTTLNTDGTTANILTWTGINSQTNGVTPGDTYARFRLSSDDLTTNDATGAASDGEVEDYALKIKNEVSGTGAGEVINDTYTSDPNTANDDLIIGGAGQDTLSGGDGDDCFHFNRTSDGIDIITDFKENGDADKLDFSDMFATGGELEGIENPFGTYVIATSDASGTLVQVDFVPGDDLNNKNVVYLQGYTDTLTADDFVF